MKLFTFKKGPLLSSLFITSRNEILKVKLSIADYFSARVEGPYSEDLLDEIIQWLQLYLDHQPQTALPIEISKLTSFRKKVLHKLQKTSLSETLSYKKLAEEAGFPKAYRAVGSTCKHNPFPLIVPCHRVVCENGQLGEYNGGVEIKKRLLQFEQATF